VRAPLYAVLNWVLQAVVFAVPVVLACTLGCLGPLVAIVLMAAAIPTPNNAVALLYRDRFPQETADNQQRTTNNPQLTTAREVD